VPSPSATPSVRSSVNEVTGGGGVDRQAGSAAAASYSDNLANALQRASAN